MGKDREGKFHPKKGKPSASARHDSVGLKDINSSAIEGYMEIADKYTVGEEEPAPNIHVRHPNRNPDKGEERKLDKRDNVNDKNASYKSKTETFTAERSKTVAEELPINLPKEQLASLASHSGDPCISVYLQTSQYGFDKNEQKDSIAFKNALQQVTYQLRQRNMDEGKIESLLKPGYDLLRNQDFWLNLTHGLAVFIAENQFRYIKMPMPPKEEVMVNSSFYLSPLIPAITSREYFYVLVLSKKQKTRLYRADAFGIRYINVPELPNGIDDVIHFEEKDDQKLFRTDTSGAGHGANFHGIGSGKPDDKANIAMYFDEVDETLMKSVLNTENAPLVLAGVEYLIPIYKQVAKYKNIWSEPLTGNHEYEDLNTLYEQASAVVAPYFMERVNKAKQAYGNQSATALTSSLVEDVVPAAYYGRIGSLFVRKNEHLWGTFDEMKNELVIHDSRELQDEDLIDKAVMKTLLNGGDVYIVEKEAMPADCPLAAIMRY